MKLFEIYNNQHQTLLEYNTAATIKKWGERLGEAGKFNWKHLDDHWWESFQDSVGVDYEEFYEINDPGEANWAVANAVLNEIEKMDPTPNKQYVQILVRWYVGVIQANKDLQKSWETYIMAKYGDYMYDNYIDWANEEGLDDDEREDNEEYFDDMEGFLITPENLETFKLEDADQITQTLNNFIRIKNQLPVQERDISRFRSFYDFEDFVDDRMDPEIKQELQNNLISRPDIDVLYNGPFGTVAVPRTEEASCLLGRGTKWCTAGKKNNMFKSYASQGDLMIYNEKPGNAKYQIHVTLDGLEMKDARDRNLSHEKSQDFRTSHPVISKLIKEKQFEIFKKLADKTFEPGRTDYFTLNRTVTMLIDLNRDWKMGPMKFVEGFYLNFFLSDPKFQQTPPTRADIGYLESYALQRKKPWPEMDKKIVAYMTNAVNLYAKNLKFTDDSRDAIILGRLIKYFKESKNPWPELDKLDEVLKTVYLRDVIERPNWQKEVDTYSWGSGPMNQ